ncbi:MAG TPA: 2-C-methyl-D-erythritol 2,4-cyclodiphosphate synthase [Candidatus Dormibacteraeota bacterium]
MRVGIGYDVHPLRPGRDLVIGGVRIDNPLGLDGHSDADVLTHAVIDSLLGAAALGDIGQHFPASAPEYQGASSQDLLAMVVRTVRQAGYRLINVDSTVIAEEPRLQPHIDAIRRQLAKTLEIELGAVSVKATSPEGLGSLGREEGIAAQAVALIEATG